MGLLVVTLWVISGAGAEALAYNWTHSTQVGIVSAFVVCGLWAWVLIWSEQHRS